MYLPLLAVLERSMHPLQPPTQSWNIARTNFGMLLATMPLHDCLAKVSCKKNHKNIVKIELILTF